MSGFQFLYRTETTFLRVFDDLLTVDSGNFSVLSDLTAAFMALRCAVLHRFNSYRPERSFLSLLWGASSIHSGPLLFSLCFPDDIQTYLLIKTRGSDSS